MITIRPMTYADLDFAADCAAAEGWTSETRDEFEGFLAYDPNGCFIAETGGRRIGICVATGYGESGFIGELIVLKEERGHGVGCQLVEHSVRYLQGLGAQNVLLDGVPAAVSLYERVGFRKVCRSMRFTGKIQCKSHPHIQAKRAEHLSAVTHMDRRAFGADRSFFLKRRLSMYPEFCKVFTSDRQILGFIMGRYGHGLVSVGPWFVGQGIDHPEDLLRSLAKDEHPLDIRLGVLETNASAVATTHSLGLTAHQDPPWRMVLGRQGHLGTSSQLYAVGSPAMG